MVAAVVAEDLDGIFRGKNDILVLSKTSMGEEPLVERIHFFEEEVPKGHPIKHMLAENLFIADDYNGIDKLWLEINVLEIDTNTGERKAAVKAFQSLAATAGAVFPAILPYAFGPVLQWVWSRRWWQPLQRTHTLSGCLLQCTRTHHALDERPSKLGHT